MCIRDSYKAYGWQTLEVESGEDIAAIEKAIEEAKADTTRPSFIRVKTVIGYPSPGKMNTGGIHGAALGDDEVAATKKVLGFDPEQKFFIADDVIAHTRKVGERGKKAHDEWNKKFDKWAADNPERKALLDRITHREFPEGWDEGLPTWDADPKGVATRKASHKVLQALGEALPELLSLIHISEPTRPY